MTTPPFFYELGQSARDVFNKRYDYGFLKANTDTRSGDMVFETSSSYNMSNPNLHAGFNVSDKIPSQGITLTARCNSDTLGTEVVMADKLLKGLKLGLTLESGYVPFLGKRNCKINGEFEHNYFSVNSDVQFDNTRGTIFNAAGVIGSHKNLCVGYQTGFDVGQSKMTNSNFILALYTGNLCLHGLFNKATGFGGSVHYEVSTGLSLASVVNWKTNEHQMQGFGVAANYYNNKSTVIKGKINNAFELGLNLTHALTPCTKRNCASFFLSPLCIFCEDLVISVSTLLNLPTLTVGGHKFGLGLEYYS